MVQTSLMPRATSSPLATVTLALAMLHVAALVSGHVLGNKSSEIGPFIVTLTVLSFPIVFLTTDLLNEHCGRAMAKRVSGFSVVGVGVAFAMIELARALPATPGTHLPAGAFDHVLAMPPTHAIGLLSGYWFGQVADISVFHRLRAITEGRQLWLRAIASTSVGESFHSTVVSIFQSILSATTIGGFPPARELVTVWSQAGVRIAIAVALLPVLYILHRHIGGRPHAGVGRDRQEN